MDEKKWLQQNRTRRMISMRNAAHGNKIFRWLQHCLRKLASYAHFFFLPNRMSFFCAALMMQKLEKS